MNKILTTIVLCFLAIIVRAQDDLLQFVFTSDVHYGITRPHFRGADSVPSYLVNEAMIDAINKLPHQRLPADGGAGSGKTIKHIEGLMITGDIANRQEKGIQSASVSWRQFETGYGTRLTIHDAAGQPSSLCVVAGNHDLADAMGSWRIMQPEKDNASLAGMYNSMVAVDHPIQPSVFDYTRNKIHYSRDWKGVHCLFVNLWPDSAERAWIDQDLAGLGANIPVLLFTHSPPEVEARFFINPNGDHSINPRDKFENLLGQTFRDGDSVEDPATSETQALAVFLKAHPSIRAWFHGHNNWTEYYTWKGPHNEVSLPCFRVDSPMKGKYSNKDEKQLSFQLITIDPHTLQLTVRECCWNTKPGKPDAPIQMRSVHTINLTGE